MRLSSAFLKTMKEVPKEAQVVSHQLMFRAGMIQKLASGIYNYLPMALRSLRKIEAIIREELEKKGCQEVLMPIVQPAELWKESGRWEYYGAELLRFKDRKDSDFCLGPTHEEVITDMVRKNLKSYKQLPWNLYQIQSKFRDEIRPRFGLMRGREFIMKDAYSFDESVEKSLENYQLMYDAYTAIFNRCGLIFKAVDAATGAIGGDRSHEFQVLAESGEDGILSCSHCGYAANEEKAAIKEKSYKLDNSTFISLEEVHTPNQKSIEEVTEFLGKKPEELIKSMVYMVDEEAVLVLVQGNKEVNEAKIQAYFNANIVHLADDKTVEEITGAATGFAGPIGLNKQIKIAADNGVQGIINMVCGANKTDYHLTDVNIERDFKADVLGDFIHAAAGEPCPVCEEGILEEHRGIEVGQVFYLGTKYSKSMSCNFLDRNGKEVPAEMGCYGIGVGRTLAAAIEQNHDDNGIIWPMAIAPYEVLIMPLQLKDEDVVNVSNTLYKSFLEAGIDAAIDDRNERAGFKFNDADLIGYPVQIIIGSKTIAEGMVEVKVRATGEKQNMKVAEVKDWMINFKSEALK
ncbi:MAG: proline--tRNA ligase [Spirochaetia bacterium]|jgi:prolyl-tRNA synthetase|nr:proline--tRNA ligase [Spirochaetia bacterium]